MWRALDAQDLFIIHSLPLTGPRQDCECAVRQNCVQGEFMTLLLEKCYSPLWINFLSVYFVWCISCKAHHASRLQNASAPLEAESSVMSYGCQEFSTTGSVHQTFDSISEYNVWLTQMRWCPNVRDTPRCRQSVFIQRCSYSYCGELLNSSIC